MAGKPRPTQDNGGNLDNPSLSLRTTLEDTNLPLKAVGKAPRTERERKGVPHQTREKKEGNLDSPSLSLRATQEYPSLPMKTAGHDLRAERERRGIQLNDVWLALKIRPNYLIAIEESRFEDLPGRAFTIGYVGRYARYLRLDVGRLVERVEAEIASREDARSVEIVPLPSQTFRLRATLVIAALLLAALTYYRNDVGPFATQAFEQATEAVLTQIDVPESAIAPMEAQAAIATPEPPIPLPTELSVPPTVSPPADVAPALQPSLPAGRQYGLRNRVSRITLRVHRATSVAVLGARNREFLDRTLDPGDTYRVPNVGNLRLSVGDAGAVEIILDGDSLGFVGKQGALARGLSLEPQAIIDRRKRR